MEKLFILFTVLLLSTSSFSQKILPEFGKIDAADLQLKSCSFEPDASAMKIFDIQNIEFNLGDYDAKLVTERRVRIKVFNQTGYKYASIRIPYFKKSGYSKIKDLDGIIYNLDSTGKIIIQKLEKKDFFKEKAEENIRVLNFTFPNLKPGSVIEFRYKKVENNWELDEASWTESQINEIVSVLRKVGLNKSRNYLV